jgi:hypothetical protein
MYARSEECTGGRQVLIQPLDGSRERRLAMAPKSIISNFMCASHRSILSAIRTYLFSEGTNLIGTMASQEFTLRKCVHVLLDLHFSERSTKRRVPAEKKSHKLQSAPPRSIVSASLQFQILCLNAPCALKVFWGWGQVHVHFCHFPPGTSAYTRRKLSR